MIEINKSSGSLLSPLFSNTEDTLVLSFTQGLLGRGWTDNVVMPTCAAIVTADFCFLSGSIDNDNGRNMLKQIQSEYKNHFLLLIPENTDWENKIELYFGDKADKFTRYATKKNTEFNIELLQSYATQLPQGYIMEKIQAKHYLKIMKHPQLKDLCASFHDWEDFRTNGTGYCILQNNEITAGASSYAYYKDGIEIEIDTDKAHRRKGLALACGSMLILNCLETGKYPSWDAHNRGSLKLSEKLGYEFSHEYTAYAVEL